VSGTICYPCLRPFIVKQLHEIANSLVNISNNLGWCLSTALLRNGMTRTGAENVGDSIFEDGVTTSPGAAPKLKPARQKH
jgi:hypothetical protein